MNYFQALEFGSFNLKLNNVNSYSLDSELLLSFALNSTREKILINLNKKIDNKSFKKYKKLILRRKNKEPIAYITKKKRILEKQIFC